ncbi:MAG: hypothetical protein JXO44_06820 [Clostridia bacterium]|nr:hypothetical protein [Clostridia bacterium]
MISKAGKEFSASNYHSETVIGEFSGRDSVAAIMKAFEDASIRYILPIATFAGTEYGDFDVLYGNYEKLLKIVHMRYGDEKTVYPLLEYSNMDIWGLMNGRQMVRVVEKYGFMSPCIGCHLYFHLTKLPFAMALSGRIISGERESHDGRIKVNQLGQSLDSYQKVIDQCGGELMMPIRNLENGDAVEELIGWDWQEGKDHPKCVLSGNYRDASGQAIFDEEKLAAYLQDYLEPFGLAVGRYLTEKGDDFSALREEVLKL